MGFRTRIVAAVAVVCAGLTAGAALSAAPAEASGPVISIGKYRHEFSPNGDGYHDRLVIPVRLRQAAYLHATVTYTRGDTDVAYNRLVCLGRPGCRLKPGTYRVPAEDLYSLQAWRQKPGRFSIVFWASPTRKARVQDVGPARRARTNVRMVRAVQGPVRTVQHFFSPNGDGQQDVARLGFTLEQPMVVQGAVRVDHGHGKVVARIPLGRMSAGHHVWDWSGLDEHGNPVPAGRYDLAIAGTQVARPHHTASSGWIGAWILDTTAPDPTVTANRTTVYPATTLFSDEVRFKFEGHDITAPQIHATVQTAAGAAVRTLTAEDTPCYSGEPDHGWGWYYSGGCPMLRWDGRDASGAVQPPGSYVLHVVGEDLAGNRAVSDTPLTVSAAPLVEHTRTTTYDAAHTPRSPGACAIPGAPQGCGTDSCGPVGSDRYADGLSFRSGPGCGAGATHPSTADFLAVGDTGHEQIRVTATGGPSTPGAPDTASLSGTTMQGDGSFVSPWIPLHVPHGGLTAAGVWSVTTQSGAAYDVASFSVEQTYFAPAP
ncbi:hypothetical protein ASC77_21625 [Nocardioides sp. Root1257]|uniref:FlgD immunoglobulin-like domain containing protein n=1 Tax=unclassified Nocardioides TaxID=2615069 RepID=UPI0006FD5EB4|nr:MULTISPECIES: FlgD immunoglobulin-like domain containing protein [unclassified Nocardioides]KQW43996.1 hypothetical protein ASC77_21625 [Nocardioides sp. Root1257]KRC42437.1 hypothetical protein ASE24_21420 [Nocardioides sp. Root224]